jgi:large subunit ribosomal protein L27
MAKTKQSGKTTQASTRKGKRLGIKIYGGQIVKPGMILVRQRGSKFHPAEGVKMGRDHTLYAVRSGTVVYKNRFKKRLVTVQ